jgi:type II secretory pathway component GspD/PulD (secretin)
MLIAGRGLAFFSATNLKGEMKLNSDHTGRCMMHSVRLLGLVLTLTLFVPGAGTQAQTAEQKPAEPKPDAEIYQTFYPANVTQQNDANDLQTDLRNMLPKARIYYAASSNAITIHATPEDIQQARKILSEIDRPKKVYRLTYTITEIDSGKRTRSEHYILVLVAASGRNAYLKQGSRVPLVTGAQESETSPHSSQVQYVDVGLNIEASLNGYADGLRLHTKVEQSSLAEEKSGVGAQDPVIRQTILDEISPLTPGKEFVLGSIDFPGTTRRQEIEVVAELVQ